MNREQCDALATIISITLDAQGANMDDKIIVFGALFMAAIECKVEEDYPESESKTELCSIFGNKLVEMLVEGLKEREKKCNTQS